MIAQSGCEAGPDPFDFAFRHALDHEHWLGTPITKFMAMAGLSALVIAGAGLLADKRSVVPRGFLRNALESALLFIRDQFARPAMGAHHGDRYVPFLATLFVFILVTNLIGLLPGAGTATSHLHVTGALAAIVLTVSLLSGILFHRGHFFHLFVPSGVPGFVVPLLFVLEFVGFLVKHAVLMIRLFANMLAGHLVIGAFIGMVWVFKSYLVGVALTVPLALFVNFLELLVAFLQAYVFTLLSSLFIGGMVHPEH
jgi:F-type H+-transporting ATPase subunit a